MAIKDYYQILGLPPQANIQDIKRAFRKKAMQWHPDLNPNSPAATAQFREIQEAYSVLSDPIQREKYHQQRWANKATGKSYAPIKDLTPYGFLLKVLELDKYMSRQDPFRTDREGLCAYIQQLLNEEQLEILKKHQDLSLNKRLVQLLLHSARILAYPQVQVLAPLLIELDEEQAPEVNRWLKNSKYDQWWGRYKGLIALLIAVLICWFIYRFA